MSGSVSIASGKEDDLLAAVATVGPISAVVDASSNAFRVCAILGHNLKRLYSIHKDAIRNVYMCVCPECMFVRVFTYLTCLFFLSVYISCHNSLTGYSC